MPEIKGQGLDPCMNWGFFSAQWLLLPYHAEIMSQVAWVEVLRVVSILAFFPLTLEDPLEKEIATHSSITAWEIPSTKKPAGM